MIGQFVEQPQPLDAVVPVTWFASPAPGAPSWPGQFLQGCSRCLSSNCVAQNLRSGSMSLKEAAINSHVRKGVKRTIGNIGEHRRCGTRSCAGPWRLKILGTIHAGTTAAVWILILTAALARWTVLLIISGTVSTFRSKSIILLTKEKR